MRRRYLAAGLLCLVIGGVLWFWPGIQAAALGSFAFLSLDPAAPVNKWPNAPPAEPAALAAPKQDLWAAARAAVDAGLTPDAPEPAAPPPEPAARPDAAPAPAVHAPPEPDVPPPPRFEPAGITHDGDVLKISDAGSAQVLIVDAGGRHAHTWQIRASMTGNAPEAAALAAAPAGRTYVHDKANYGVRILDAHGRQVGDLRDGGHALYATGITADRNHVFVADALANAVHVYRHDGTRVGFLAGTQGAFTVTGGIAHAGGHVFVSDMYGGAVYAFSKDGGGMAGRLIGALSWPDSITIGGGRIYVADVLAGNVHVFDAAGRHVDTVADPGDVRQHRTPAALTHNGTHLFVADRANDRVEIWDGSGVLVTTIP